MKFKSILVVAALGVLSAFATAQSTARTFAYTSSDAVDADYSAAPSVALLAKTKVTVSPYLYIKGNLGANWQVDGWGAGEDSKLETIRFYHNEGLTLAMSSFANAVKTSGGAAGAQSIALKGQMVFSNDTSGVSLFDSGLVDVADFNTAFTPAGPNFDSTSTGGILKLAFSRKIILTANVGPGVYENTGTITVIRN